MLESRTIHLNKVQLHYVEAPGPGPALVILHGLSGSHAEFRHLAPVLAKRAHVYLLDLRGHGCSGRAADGYQLADYGRDVAVFLQQVVGRPVVLMGHSLGALAATWLAANYPHLLHSLLLEDPPFYILQTPRFQQTDFYPYFAGLYDFLKVYHANGAVFAKLEAYVGHGAARDEQLPNSQAFTERVDPDADHAAVNGGQTVLELSGAAAVRERALQLHQMDPAVLEPALDGTLLGRDEVDDLLAQIHCPVHVVAAQFDRSGALSAADLQRAAAHMPHCTYTVIANAGHDIHLDQPQAVLHELKQVLARWS